MALGSDAGGFAPAVEVAGKGVVRVEGRRRVPASGVFGPGSSLVVTAQHVLRRDEGIRVGLPDGEVVEARLVGRDPSRDLGLLELSGASAPEGWAWGEGEGLAVGQIALAVGRPGRDLEASLGLVSALGGAWRRRGGATIDRFLRADLVMYPGFSGGALVDAAGRVQGLLSSALARGAAIALPTATVGAVVEELAAHGHIRRARLGVGVQAARLPKSEGEDRSGLLVVHVEEDGPAERAGLFVGDLLLTLADHPLPDADALLEALGTMQPGSAVPLTLLRAGTRVTQEVTLGETPGEAG